MNYQHNLPTIKICFLESANLAICFAVLLSGLCISSMFSHICNALFQSFKFQILRIINSQNINSPSGAICKVFGNFFLRLIRIMKFSPINTLYLFMFLRTNNSAVNINCNINLNGNTAGSFRMLSKISSYKLSENSPYVLAIVPSSRNTQ